MAQDPWAWANQALSAPLNNTMQAQKQQEMAPGQRQPQGPLGMAQNMVVAKGVNSGVNTATDPKAWQSLGNTISGGNVDLAANASAQGGDAMANLMSNTGAYGTAPLGAESGAVIGGAEAATTAAIPAAATEVATAAAIPAEAAVAGTAATTAAVGAPLAAGGAAAAAPLAAMGPVGWGIGAALLAKQLKII